MPSCNTCMIHTKSPGAFQALWHTQTHHLDVSQRRNADSEWHAYRGIRSLYTYKWTIYRLPTSWHKELPLQLAGVVSPHVRTVEPCRAECRYTATLQPATLTVTLGPTWPRCPGVTTGKWKHVAGTQVTFSNGARTYTHTHTHTHTQCSGRAVFALTRR